MPIHRPVIMKLSGRFAPPAHTAPANRYLTQIARRNRYDEVKTTGKDH